MDIGDWRKKIDGLDQRLVDLLNERARCVVAIGELKRKNALPVHAPSREEEVMRRVIGANAGPLPDEALSRIFERIVDEGKKLQSLPADKKPTNKTMDRKAQNVSGDAKAASPYLFRGRKFSQ